MKYIITESRLRKLVNKYLDSLDFTYQKKIKNDEFFLSLHKELVFEYRNRPDEDTKTLMIKYPFINNLSTIFGLNTDELIPILIDWVNENYGTDLNELQWNWVL
jgi:hypothetical protein